MTAPQDPFAAPDGGGVPQQGDGQPPARGFGEPSAQGQVPYGTAAPAARNGLGTGALVCGILAVVGIITVIGGIVLGIVAIVLGILGRGRAKQQQATNGSSATAGLVLGAIALVLSGALVAFGVSLLNGESGKELRDCLADAGSDATAQQQCQQDFQKDVTG